MNFLRLLLTVVLSTTLFSSFSQADDDWNDGDSFEQEDNRYPESIDEMDELDGKVAKAEVKKPVKAMKKPMKKGKKVAKKAKRFKKSSKKKAKKKKI